MMPLHLQRNTIQAPTNQRLGDTRGDIQYTLLFAAAEDAIGRRVAGGDHGQLLTSGRKYVNAGQLAATGGGVNVAVLIQRHTVNAAAIGPNVEEDFLVGQSTVLLHIELHQMMIALGIAVVVRHVHFFAIQRHENAVGPRDFLGSQLYLFAGDQKYALEI